jgi:uncharacterized protein YndB with AHSA1/START domain
MSGMQAETSLFIDAPPDRIWRLISDVTRMGQWSPITYKCEWVEGSSGPVKGAKFKGYNKMSPARWWTLCEVTEAEPAKVFEFRTMRVSFPISIGVGEREMTRWRYTFEPEGIGTKVTERYEASFVPPLLSVPEVIARKVGFGKSVDRRREQTYRGMDETLQRLKAAAED